MRNRPPAKGALLHAHAGRPDGGGRGPGGRRPHRAPAFAKTSRERGVRRATAAAAECARLATSRSPGARCRSGRRSGGRRRRRSLSSAGSCSSPRKGAAFDGGAFFVSRRRGPSGAAGTGAGATGGDRRYRHGGLGATRIRERCERKAPKSAHLQETAKISAGFPETACGYRLRDRNEPRRTPGCSPRSFAQTRCLGGFHPGVHRKTRSNTMAVQTDRQCPAQSRHAGGDDGTGTSGRIAGYRLTLHRRRERARLELDSGGRAQGVPAGPAADAAGLAGRDPWRLGGDVERRQPE